MTDQTSLPLFRPRRPRPFGGLARAARWHRRKLAVLASLAAVLCTLAAASPSESASVPVAIATRDLAGGQVLSAEDLRLAHYPADLAPAGAVAETSALIGRHLITGAGSGTPLTHHSVITPRGPQPGEGQALVPARLDDAAVAGLLRVGDRVDVIASPADGSPATVVAAGARVLALPGGEQAGSGPLGAAVDSRGPLVLLEVSTAEAEGLVQAQTRHRLTVVLR